MLINLPEDLFERLQQLAAETAQPLEDIVVRRLKSSLALPMLPADEEAELAALEHLSDDALWTIARERLPESVQERMQTLMDRNDLGEISPGEYVELSVLVERGQRLTLRKARSAALLTRRGYTITEDASGSDYFGA